MIADSDDLARDARGSLDESAPSAVDRDPFRVAHVVDKIDGDTVYVGRTSLRMGLVSGRFYNPYIIGATSYDWLPRGQPATREDVIAKYRVYLLERPSLLRQLPQLRGKILVCWCRHYGQREPACHADVLLELLDRYTDDELRAMQ
jgi:hypothetical protein